MYHLQHDHRQAEVEPAERAMLDYAVKLNNTPGEMTAQDLQPLRDAGFDDVGIMDVVMVVSLFNFMNRVADGLGVQTEEAMEKSKARGDKRARKLLDGPESKEKALG